MDDEYFNDKSIPREKWMDFATANDIPISAPSEGGLLLANDIGGDTLSFRSFGDNGSLRGSMASFAPPNSYFAQMGRPGSHLSEQASQIRWSNGVPVGYQNQNAPSLRSISRMSKSRTSFDPFNPTMETLSLRPSTMHGRPSSFYAVGSNASDIPLQHRVSFANNAPTVTNDMISNAVRGVIRDANVDEMTKRTACKQVEERLGTTLFAEQKKFCYERIDAEIDSKLNL